MEQTNYMLDMLELISQPAFCVQNGIIIGTNTPARQLQLHTGDAVAPLLETGADEYRDFTGGALSLTICISNATHSATVVRKGNADIFRLDEDVASAQLLSMALAAQALREPLSGMMAVTDSLLSESDQTSAAREQISKINHGLYQINRLVGNMTEANRTDDDFSCNMQLCNITAVFDELMNKAQALVEKTGRSLEYTGPSQDIEGCIDSGKLERAVYNLISNAIKFSPESSLIHAKLSRSGNKLYFSVSDNGEGIAQELRGSVFTRYQRQPGIEDGRYGIGLGLVLVRAAATAHGGTVLMEQAEPSGTKVTMSIALKQDTQMVRSPVLTVDLSGGYSRELIELSDVLPSELYI